MSWTKFSRSKFSADAAAVIRQSVALQRRTGIKNEYAIEATADLFCMTPRRVRMWSECPTLPAMDVQTIIDAAGGVAQLQEKLGVARTTILDWKRLGTIPANRVAQISERLDLPLAEVVKLAPTPKEAVA